MTKNSDVPRSFRIKYDVHCRFKNHFKKEIIVKNCYSEIHAKFKLGAFCEKQYGKEFECIKFISVSEETIQGLFGDIFGDDVGYVFGNKKYKDDFFGDFMKNLKNKKK